MRTKTIFIAIITDIVTSNLVPHYEEGLYSDVDHVDHVDCKRAGLSGS